MKTNQAIWLLSFLFFLPLSEVYSETFHLKSGEAVKGKIQTLEKGKYTIVLPDGKTKKIDQKDITSIDFAEAKPAPKKPTKPATAKKPTPEIESPYSTPLKTFKLWREAAIKGDIDQMIKCYASFKQEEKKNELKKISRTDFEKMRAATAETVFTPAVPLYQGDHATLEVNWTKGLNGDSQVFQFILEKDEWKFLE